MASPPVKSPVENSVGLASRPQTPLPPNSGPSPSPPGISPKSEISTPVMATVQCCTRSNLATLRFDWQLENFSYQLPLGTSLTSVLLKNSEIGLREWPGEWQIQVTPCSRRKEENAAMEKDYMSVYVQCKLKDDESICARYHIAITDSNGTTLFFRDTMKPVVFNPKTASIRGWPQFITHEELLRDEKHLPDDTLHLRATVTFLIGTSPSSSLTFAKEESSSHLLLRDFEALYRSKKNTDVVLIASDSKPVMAHRVILAARCACFGTMFAQMKEGSGGKCEVKDVDGDTLEVLVEYLYTGSLARAEGIAKKLMKAAHQYNMPELKVALEPKLISILTVNSAAEHLILADTLGLNRLKTAALQRIAENMTSFSDVGGMQEVRKSKPTLQEEIMRFFAAYVPSESPCKKLKK